MIGYKLSLSTLAVAIGLTASAASHGSVIRISNANNHEIPLRAGSVVQFDSAGNLIAECALNASNVCAELSNGSTGGTLPTATLARNDTNTEVTAGEAIRLTWGSTGASVCSASGTGPASTPWPGPKATADATGQTITLTAAGSYSFSLQCFNGSGASTQQIINVSVGAAQDTGTGGTGACTITGHPLVAPPSLTRIDKTWVKAWSSPDGTSTAVYPNSVGSVVPVGSEKGHYTVIPFTPSENLSVGMFWDVAQPSTGYLKPRPANAMFISISPCPGDLRPSNNNSTDPFERSACRLLANTGSLYYTTTASTAVCKLQAGVQYYINVSPIDTSDGLQAGEDTCGNALTGCDVQATHRAQ